MPEMKERLGMLQTPVIAIKKGNKLVRWHYSLSDNIQVKAGETSKYMKGLGSFKASDLVEVVQKDGLENMIDLIEFDNEEIIDDWLNDKKADIRKEYLTQNVFSIAQL